MNNAVANTEACLANIERHNETTNAFITVMADQALEQAAAIDAASEPVTGTVRMKLYKGGVAVTGRKSPNSLYDEAMVTFEEDTVYDQRDAEGFIKLNALRLRIGKRSRN